MKQRKTWKDLTFDEKVVKISEFPSYEELNDIANKETERRREHREKTAILLEMRGWIDLYDTLKLLGIDEEEKAKIHPLARKHSLSHYKVGMINYYKKEEILTLAETL
jgi:hypothetical protein